MTNIAAHSVHVNEYAPRGPVTAHNLARHSVWREGCVICDQAFSPGVWFAVIPTPEPFNEVEAAKAERNEPYRVKARPAHWECVVVRFAAMAGMLRVPAVA